LCISIKIKNNLGKNPLKGVLAKKIGHVHLVKQEKRPVCGGLQG